MSNPLSYSTEHPHGPEDPRWIDAEGRCVLCGRDHWQAEAARLSAELEALKAVHVTEETHRLLTEAGWLDPEQAAALRDQLGGRLKP